MKKIILIITILVTTSIYTQNSDIIKITTSASGITKEIAIQDALRSALEQSYGSFISTKTNIKNDELLNDEIVAITSGEIHDYELVSETKIESGYAVTIVAKISQTGLNNFVTQSGGDAIIFDANVFSTKIRLQKLNEEAEIKSINNLLEVLEEIYARSIEFEFTSSNPKFNRSNKNWGVNFELTTKYNENILSFIDFFSSSLEKIAMTEKQKIDYNELGKSTYPILVNNEFYYFRNAASYVSINNFLNNLRNKFAEVEIKTNNGLHVAGPFGNKEHENYFRNFFIPYLNHSENTGVIRRGNSWGKYEYHWGPCGQDYTLTGQYYGPPSISYLQKNMYEPGVPTGSDIILMLNKDLIISVKLTIPNTSYPSYSMDDEGLIFRDNHKGLFMENSPDFEFSFNPDNKEIIYVDGIELTIDQYLSQKNFIKPTYYTRSFKPRAKVIYGNYYPNRIYKNGQAIRWGDADAADINNLNFSKRNIEKIQKIIDEKKINLEEGLKLKLKKLIESISSTVKNDYNCSRGLNARVKYNFYKEFNEDQMFSITGYKLINKAKK